MQAASDPVVVRESPAPGGPRARTLRWRALVPLVIGGGMALVPAPDGLAPAAWLYFALFASVIAGIISEPIPLAALGLAGVSIAAVLGLVRDTPAGSVQWALSGFSNPIVWLIFAAFMFTLGYAHTGLGRRVALHLVRALGHRTLGLGYAVALADLAFAPFTPSATARSAGTIYPVISQIPPLYGSHPGDGTARLMGAYLLYTALAVSFVTSSMFITALAPNALAISIVGQTAGVQISWIDWARGFAPVGCVLLAVVPLVLYRIYPPVIRHAPDVPRWADDELRRLGPVTRREATLCALVAAALAAWIGATEYVDPALTAIVVVLLMVLTGVVSWDDVIGEKQAWNMLIWFGTVVTLAGGLAETGFVAWLADLVAPSLTALGTTATIGAVIGTFFFLHYFFASTTAHTATLLPVFLAVAITVTDLSPTRWSLLLVYTLGLMGILTSYGSGQSVVYYASGYISRRDFWLLGLVVGLLYLAVYLAIIVPWLAYLGW